MTKKTTEPFLKPSEVLAKAAKIAKTIGHCKHNFFVPSFFDFIGGVERGELPEKCCIWGAVRLAHQSSKTRVKYAPHLIDLVDEVLGQSAVAFNDKSTTTKEDVVKALRKGAALARKAGK